MEKAQKPFAVLRCGRGEDTVSAKTLDQISQMQFTAEKPKSDSGTVEFNQQTPLVENIPVRP